MATPTEKKHRKPNANPSLTAKAWARGLGLEVEYGALTREQRFSLRVALKASKTAPKFQRLRDEATARLVRFQAIFDKKAAFCKSQIERGEKADAALAALAAAENELRAIKADIAGTPVVAEPPVVPTATAK